MTKRAVFLFLLGVLCVSTALAGTKRHVQYKLDGKTAGGVVYADLPGSGGGHVRFAFSPAPLPDGSPGYEADVYWTEDGITNHEISGLVPASAVNAKGVGGPITVNITTALFYDVPGSPFQDSGDFVSLAGTFTAYTGVGSSTDGQNGRSYQTETLLDGSTETQSFNGTVKYQSATFEGTLVALSGTYDLSVQGPFPNAVLFVQVGTMTDIITTP
jgi:hypothetical protein